jgi:ABC-type transport system involved in multi-copper enzyme maturation permease subunit
MSGMTPFFWMLLVWGAVTIVFVILMIYRSLVTMREDDQLFLNDRETAMEAEQKVVQRKISRLRPYTQGFGFASAGLAVIIFGVWIYRGITQVNVP